MSQESDAISEPPCADCVGPADVGKLHHDEVSNTWYECFWDERHGVYTWVIVPPVR